ncbi:MAG: hypothetical protein ACYCVN_13735 [Acidimicrobiales bacterium]
MVGQGLGHVVFTFVPLPPFIALTVVSIIQRHGLPRRLGIRLGLLLVAQYLISPEVFTAVVLSSVVALICCATRYRQGLADVSRHVAVPFGIALAIVSGPSSRSGRTQLRRPSSSRRASAAPYRRVTRSPSLAHLRMG